VVFVKSFEKNCFSVHFGYAQCTEKRKINYF